MVELPFGFAERGKGGAQVVESAAAGKASIEEINKEKALKNRVRVVGVRSFLRPPNLSLPLRAPHQR